MSAQAENPYDHISDRGGPAPVMQRSHDRPAGLDNPRAPRRAGGMPNFEKYTWLFMRFSGLPHHLQLHRILPTRHPSHPSHPRSQTRLDVRPLVRPSGGLAVGDPS